MKKSILTIATLLLTVASLTLSAHAQDVTNKKTPEYTNVFRVVNQADLSTETPTPHDSIAEYPTLKLTPDKSLLLKTDHDIATVIIGNPAHLSVLPSTTRGLVLVGKQPGATHFIALNQQGQVIMQRHVIVAAPKNEYIRVRKTCAGSEDQNCQTMRVYYCPDACHETAVVSNEEQADKQASNDAANLNAPQPGQYMPPPLPPVDNDTE